MAQGQGGAFQGNGSRFHMGEGTGLRVEPHVGRSGIIPYHGNHELGMGHRLCGSHGMACAQFHEGQASGCFNIPDRHGIA